jgi:O-antigen ligase
VPAVLVAAGVASASRAGAVLLLAESAIVLLLLRRPRVMAQFALLVALLVTVSGAGALLGRLADPDPLRYRREIAASAVQMISAHPWRGFGLGTFREVYPAYATFDAGALVEHAHDDWLEWAAEGGIPFALLWLTLAAACVRPALRVWGIGILAAFLHAIVDYPFARFGLTAWTFTLIGALDAAEVREVNPSVH